MKPELFGAFASMTEAIEKIETEIVQCERLPKDADDSQDIENTLMNLRQAKINLDQAASAYVAAYPAEVLTA